MKLAASSHRKLETFFREHLHDEDFRLPVIYFYAGKLTRILTDLIGVHGITFGRHIYIKPSLIVRDDNHQLRLSANLTAHEIAHVLQYEREGYGAFFYKYLSDYRRNLRKKDKNDAFARQEAYLEIPFEIEASAVAEQFVEWKRKIGK
ncbi:MAG: DUF4157 domain-containing protein [Acidobacteriota bacterium]|nr:DUF4157 domain-containing protein [Acidobacteriota bacterium]